MPELPTGDIGRTFQQVIQQVAPDLWMTLQSGAVDQAGGIAQSILNNPARMAAIQQSISQQAGGANANISELLSTLVQSVKPTGNMTNAPTAAATVTATDLLNTASDVITTSSTTSGTTIAEGAIPVSLVVQGNADSVTVRQLQGTLQAFGSQIVQELVARS